MRIGSRIVRYKTESENVSGCSELQWKQDRQTDILVAEICM